MIKGRKSFGIIWQVAILFVLGTLVVSIWTYFSQRELSENLVIESTEHRAESIAKEVRRTIEQYPAHDALMKYWYDHYKELDIEYDTDFRAATDTEQKCWLLAAHQPNMQLRYVNTNKFNNLPAEDQKLYAEIVYAWVLARLDEIKQSHKISFLFCVVSEEPFDKQFFLLSAAESKAERGTEYGQVYPIGTVADVITEYTQEAMRDCAENKGGYLADANAYMDYYAYLGNIDDHVALTGVTYDLTDIRANIEAQTKRETRNMTGYLAGLAILCLGLIYLAALRPLKKIQETIQTYRETKESGPVVESMSKISFHNEIGRLSEDVSNLALSIDDYTEQIATISAEKERIGAELSVANRIQTSMLPSTFPPFPDRAEFDIFASMEPAKEVGGDFYDFFLIDEDHLGIVIADVSGKGVPAALFMMASKIIIANNAKMGKSPAQIMSDSNTSIMSNNPEEMFVTAWVGVLEISTGKLTAANAGHEYPFLKSPDGPFKVIKDKHGFIIGGMDGVKYQYHLQLEPGSKFFIYTDGLAEATNADQKLFGSDRIGMALNAAADLNPRAILEKVTEAVDDFVQDAEQFDDLTMLCIEYRGPAKPEED